MLLFRSMFWLTLAYIVIKPGVDFNDAATMSAQAMAAGQQVVAQQVQGIDCDTLQCIGGKAVLTAALSTPAPSVATTALAPMPRPRPDRS